MDNYTQKDIDRFWSKTIKREIEDCWIWSASCFNSGYGAFHLRGKIVKAHRFAYILSHGEIPNELEICHKCDNPSCVNPAHLFSGTHKENMLDMHIKGRFVNTLVPGNKSAKLTIVQVKEIRFLYSTGAWTQKALAQKFSVYQTTVSKIIRWESWRDI